MRLPVARREGLLVTEVYDETVIYDVATHVVHRLNATTTVVWRHCNGSTTPRDVAALLYQDCGLPMDERIVHLALHSLADAGLLVPGTDDVVAGVSRRQLMVLLTRAGLALAAIPVIESMLVPTPAAAVSIPPIPPPPPPPPPPPAPDKCTVAIQGTKSLYVFCERENQSKNLSIVLTAEVGPPSSYSYFWTVQEGQERIRFKGSRTKAQVTITPSDAAHASESLEDVLIHVTAYTAKFSCGATHRLTVRKPWVIVFDPSATRRTSPSGKVTYYSYDVVYRVQDQFCVAMPAALIAGMIAREDFPVPPPLGCPQGTGNARVHRDGTIHDNQNGPGICVPLEFVQTISMDCARVTNSVTVNPSASEGEQLQIVRDPDRPELSNSCTPE